jgi:hypothetical protein
MDAAVKPFSFWACNFTAGAEYEEVPLATHIGYARSRMRKSKMRKCCRETADPELRAE